MVFVGVPSWASHWANHFFLWTSQAIGYRLEDIRVEGRFNTHPQELLHAVGLKYSDPIFTKSVEEIATSIHHLPWVDQVIVQRILPNKLRIVIQERTPIAIWQYQHCFYFVDIKGHTIALPSFPAGTKLPIFVGKNAHEQIQHFLKVLPKYTNVAKRLSISNWIRERRWDLILDQHVRVQLPAQDLEKALENLEKIVQRPQFHPKILKKIDLRNANMIVVELTKQAKLIPLDRTGTV